MLSFSFFFSATDFWPTECPAAVAVSSLPILVLESNTNSYCATINDSDALCNAALIH